MRKKKKRRVRDCRPLSYSRGGGGGGSSPSTAATNKQQGEIEDDGKAAFKKSRSTKSPSQAARDDDDDCGSCLSLVGGRRGSHTCFSAEPQSIERLSSVVGYLGFWGSDDVN